MNPVCGICGKTMKKVKSGIVVAEMFGQPPVPYKLWSADLYACGCGCQVVGGWAEHPLAEHFQPNFAEVLAKHPIDIYWHESKGP